MRWAKSARQLVTVMRKTKDELTTRTSQHVRTLNTCAQRIEGYSTSGNSKHEPPQAKGERIERRNGGDD
jgi:hypothetical protein